MTMSEHMIRKQIYIPRRQNLMLKRLAKQRGVSEAEVIRQALEREAEKAQVGDDGEKAFVEMQAFAESRKEKYAGKGEPFKWNRAEIYEERESRWFKTPEEK
jgi:hypothetical protein